MRNKLYAILYSAGFTPVFAGGLLTNTNQNAAFLRNPSRDAVIATDGVYTNPAGVAFLENGFHLTLSIQNARQTREIVSTFKAFSQGIQNQGEDSKRFVGKANAPVIPSFQASYNTDKWSFNGSFALTGGGGKCTFDKGLGSFEAVASLLPLLGESLGINGYDMNSYMRGRQYYYGLQLGAARKITDNLSVFGGVRGIYATTNYYGYIQDIQIKIGGNTEPANEYFSLKHDQAIRAAEAYREAGNEQMAQLYEQQATQMNALAYATQDVRLNCDQNGFGITPIVGFDWKINSHWNIAAKYEFKTRIRLKNESANSESANNFSSLAQFQDGEKDPEDIPALLTLGVQYSPIDRFRLSAGYHYFFDRQARKYGHSEKKLSRGTREFSAGIEFDATKNLTISGGWQNTNYGLTDAYMEDISFTTSSNSIGCGINYRFNKRWSIDASYFLTLYNTYNTTSSDYNSMSRLVAGLAGAQKSAALVENGTLTGSNHYWRTNRVFGVGVTMDF